VVFGEGVRAGGEDGAGDGVERLGHLEAGGGEGLPEGVAMAVDVEIPQGEHVGAVAVVAAGPFGEPGGRRVELVEAALVGLAVVDVEGDEHEAGAARLE